MLLDGMGQLADDSVVFWFFLSITLFYRDGFYRPR
jgi:hypothetical protein